MKSWIWPLADLGVNRKATTAGRPAIPGCPPGGEGRRVMHGVGRGAIPIITLTTRVPTPTLTTHALTRIGGRCFEAVHLLLAAHLTAVG